jgi:hypothetical protein
VYYKPVSSLHLVTSLVEMLIGTGHRLYSCYSYVPVSEKWGVRLCCVQDPVRGADEVWPRGEPHHARQPGQRPHAPDQEVSTSP